MAISETQDSQSATKGRKRSISYFTWAVLFSLPTLLAFGARWHWTLELFTHFRVYYLWMLLPCAGLFLFRRKYLALLLVGACLAINVAQVVPLYFGPERVAAGDDAIRGMVVNVRTSNPTPEKVIEYVRSENPDYVIFIEIDDRWMKRLAVLKEDYPHSLDQPRSDNFGIAMFSRLPVASIQNKTFGKADVPTVVAELVSGDRPFTLVGTHPVPPMSARNARSRDEQMEHVAEYVSNLSGPVILMVDLNITSWSPPFGDFLSETGLRDSRYGFGVQATWSPGRLPLRIPIDHVLVSDEIVVHDRRVGPDVGSDHRGVVVDFSLR